MNRRIASALCVLALGTVPTLVAAQESIVYVNDDWASLSVDDVIPNSEADFGRELVVGTNAFATINEGITAVREGVLDTDNGNTIVLESGGAVVVLPGEYNEQLNITKNAIRLYGPAAASPATRVLDPSWDRADEAVVTWSGNNQYTVRAAGFNTIIDGFYIEALGTSGNANGINSVGNRNFIANNIITKFADPIDTTTEPLNNGRGVEIQTGVNSTTFHNNFVSGFLTGVFNNPQSGDNPRNRLIGNYFHRNRVGSGNDNIIEIDYLGNTFDNNTLEAIGVGVAAGDFRLERNTFILPAGETNRGINLYGDFVINGSDNHYVDTNGVVLELNDSAISADITDDESAEGPAFIVTAIDPEPYDIRGGGDADLDGLPANLEALLGTSDNDLDSSGNGVEDGILFAFGYDPSDPDALTAAQLIDNDGDGLVIAFDPDDNDDDFDGNNIRNGYEFATGSNPFIASSVPSIGDVNEDGVVDLADVLIVFRLFLGLDPQSETVNPANADVNRDGSITNLDGTLLVNFVLGNSTIPFP